MNKPAWLKKLKTYAIADTRQSIIQLLATVIPYLLLVSWMYLLMINGYPYWVILIVSVIAAGFHVRLFIIFHDCTHYSFFNSKRVCNILGHCCGVLTFTDFSQWQHAHNIHHANVGNLDKRGVGDVWVMTLKEYKASSKLKRFIYRLYRNPFFLFFIAPVILFLIINRFPKKIIRKKDIPSLIFTNLSITMIIVIFWFTIGIEYYLAIQLPIIYFATIAGVWIFYIQHQFSNVYWAYESDWQLFRAAMEGSSLYMLPAVLRWLTNNIGYHHVHHLNSRIPGYKLKKCYDEIEPLQAVVPVKFFRGFYNMFLKLYDEESKSLIKFSQIKE